MNNNLTSDNLHPNNAQIIHQLILSINSIQHHMTTEATHRQALSAQISNLEMEQRKCSADIARNISELMIGLHKEFATREEVSELKSDVSKDRRELKECIDNLRAETKKDIRWSLGITFGGGAMVLGFIQWVIGVVASGGIF